MNGENQNIRALNDFFKVEDTNALVEYLQKKLSHSKDGKTYSLEIVKKEKNGISGYINDVSFSIMYERGNATTLAIENGKQQEIQKLSQLLELVVWSCNDSNADFKRSDKIASYVIGPLKMVVWDSNDPEKTIRTILYGAYSNNMVRELEIFHPKYKNVNLDEYIKYGVFEGMMDTSVVEQIKKCSEFELFYHITSLAAAFDKCEKAGQLLHQDVDAQLNGLTYSICYASQQAKRFGVKVQEPSKLPTKPTREFCAWLEWWGNAYNKLLVDEPERVNSWQNMPNGLDPEFRPEGSYYDLLDYAPNADSQPSNEE